MKEQVNTGGPAFPTGLTPGHYSQEGMTLRDWFAGQAIVGIINACAMDSRDRSETTEAMFARKAVSIADAMIAALEAKP